MAVTPPSAVPTTDIDAAGDDPKLARAVLLTTVQNLNTVLTQYNSLGIMQPGDGVEQSAAGAGTKDYLRVKLDGSSLARGAAGLKIADDGITFAMIAQNGAATDNVIKWNGTDWVASAPLAGSPTGAMTAFAGVAAPSGWLLCNGAIVSRSTYSALWAVLARSATATMTIASPCVVTWNSHGLIDDDPIIFRTSGALPTGVVAGTTYYVKGAAANTFNLAATPGGSNINTSGSQSGTHTAWFAPWGDGDGSTSFALPDLRGRVPVGQDNMGGSSAQNRMTYASSGVGGKTLGHAGGAQTHTLTEAQMPSHTHSLSPTIYNTGGGSSGGLTSTTANIGSPISISAAGSSAAHNNTQPSIITNWIIKT